MEGAEFTKEHSEIAGLRTRDLLVRLLEERCLISPVVLYIEDLHWMDTASEALLARLVSDAGERRLLTIFTYRPGYTPPWEGQSKCHGIGVQTFVGQCHRRIAARSAGHR